MDLHPMRFPESENYIFSVVCPCVSVITITHTNHSTKSKFRILYFYHIQTLLETFYEDQTHNLCTGAHKIILIHYSRNSKSGILHLYHMQILPETFHEYRTKTLFIETHKRILILYGLWTEFLSSTFQYIQTVLNITKFVCNFAMLKTCT